MAWFSSGSSLLPWTRKTVMFYINFKEAVATVKAVVALDDR